MPFTPCAVWRVSGACPVDVGKLCYTIFMDDNLYKATAKIDLRVIAIFFVIAESMAQANERSAAFCYALKIAGRVRIEFVEDMG